MQITKKIDNSKIIDNFEEEYSKKVYSKKNYKYYEYFNIKSN